MNFILSINTFIASLGILGFIIIDYGRNKSTDSTQRKIFFIIIFATIASILAEIAYDCFEGHSGSAENSIFYTANFLFFLFQPIAHYTIFLFFDYNINKDTTRIKYLSYMLGALFCINILIFLFNINRGFIFYITPDNAYVMGRYYFVRLIISFSPVTLGFIDIFLCRKKIDRHQAALFIIFMMPPVLGGLLDLIVKGLRLLWPCSSISILFAYFFIIRADYRIDGLTGVNNRRSCDEFLNNMAKITNRKSYAYMMIDMDHFKQINDVWGHLQGDMALKDAAQLLKDSIRQTDFIARYGGDEFIIVMTEFEDVDMVLNRIKNKLVEFNAKKTRVFNLEFSIGHDIYKPDNIMTPQEFLSHVDDLMYANKERRKEIRQGKQIIHQDASIYSG